MLPELNNNLSYLVQNLYRNHSAHNARFGESSASTLNVKINGGLTHPSVLIFLNLVLNAAGGLAQPSVLTFLDLFLNAAAPALAIFQRVGDDALNLLRL